MFFGLNNQKFLTIFYNALLTGMPSLTYNPINKNILHAPFTVNEKSTYINYRLNNEQFNVINDYLKNNNNNNNNNLILQPSSIISDSDKDYFLSINIYNCTSPIFEFISDEPSTRCEINVYVKDKKDNKGTLITDYVSSILSLDPDNLFKSAGKINLINDNELIKGYANCENFALNFDYNQYLNTNIYNKISSNLVKYTDKIFYNNGIYDKLYYDSSLINNNIIECLDYNVDFKFLNVDFLNVDSLFYFENKINFVGGLWYNLYDTD